MSSLTIKAEQRDVLYEHILCRLTGIDDVYLAVESGDFDAADRLSLEFADYLRLLHYDLGWGDGVSATVELTSPAEVLRRAVSRLEERAEAENREEEAERAEAQRQQQRNQLMRETCRQLLAELKG